MEANGAAVAAAQAVAEAAVAAAMAPPVTEKREREDEAAAAAAEPPSKRAHTEGTGDEASAPAAGAAGGLPPSVQAAIQAAQAAAANGTSGAMPADASQAAAPPAAAAVPAAAPAAAAPAPAAAAPAAGAGGQPDLTALAANLPPEMLQNIQPLLAQLQQSGDSANALAAQLVATALSQAKGVPEAALTGASAPLSPTTGRPASFGGDDMGDISYKVDVACPVEHVGRIIGKSGEMIKTLQRNFQVRIQIDQKAAGLQHRQVHVSGSQAGVDGCVQRIRNIIETASAATRGDPMGAPHLTPANPAHVTKTLTCANETVGRVIGRSGENIRRTEAATGCKVQVNQKGMNNEPRHVSIMGNPEDVAKALTIVNALIAGNTILDWNIPTIVPGPAQGQAPGSAAAASPYGAPHG
eukprot:CAMPEP_0118860584 /NCGR_PEP_ID=MMETSP1163-20130328/6382_1 /TAXON_ID=124430 /ORGANISM="Phaeomonas parva, Strain CCMP2877" /LENGTH=410 /DNA_ID=CAMNT_0006794295 /DNA_START=250 /DNA_END=1479 /DNA_ORIENTATION=-